MKNVLKHSNGSQSLLANVDDDTNRIFINDSEVASSLWVGSGTYTQTIDGVTISITKISDLSGNIMLQKVSDNNYQLVRKTDAAIHASQVKYGNSDVKTELDQINTSLTDINADLSDKQDSNTAVKHTASTAVGSTTQPVYVDANGNVKATSYSVAKSVPSNAVFTDTKPTYTNVVNALGYVPNNFLLEFYTTSSFSIAANTSTQCFYRRPKPSGRSGGFVCFNSFNGVTMLSLNHISLSVSGSQVLYEFWVNNHNASIASFTISFFVIWY